MHLPRNGRKSGQAPEARGERKHRMKRTFVFFVVVLLSTVSIGAQSSTPLTLRRTMVLSGVTGRFDHFAIDEAGNRLFAAVPGSRAVKIIDLATGKVAQSLAGLGKPHGLAWVAATGNLYVADGALSELRVYKGTPLVLAGTIKLSDDADDMVYDKTGHQLFVGHGGSDAANPARIAIVDSEHFTLAADLPVASHPEALEIDPGSQRVFANIADSNEIVVIDAATRTIAMHWKVTKASDNVPIAFDNEHQLIFVACRNPGLLIALNADTGKESADEPAAGKADDLFYDSRLRRVYLISGTGEVDTFQIDETKNIHPRGVLRTADGAKTALFVPSQNLLYVGVPGSGEQPAEIRVYSTTDSGANR
jgi:DNA-binding beta-propeller fold protein YncE